MPTEPTSADIAAVAAAIGDTPPAAPVQAPAAPVIPEPAQPIAPASQPVPAPVGQPLDPFAALAQPPAAPTPPQPTATPNPQPAQPVEPSQPVVPAPVAPVAPATPAEQPYETFEEYMARVDGTVGAPPAQPDPSTINPEDPEAIKTFFDDIINTAVDRAKRETAKAAAIQASERTLWDAAFAKYGSLRDNKKARDLVHSIRMGYFQRGTAITPVQAADVLLDSMGQQYKAGVADSAVVTTIENTQPLGGGTGQPVQDTASEEETLLSLQDGGEVALADMLDREIRAGNL